MQLTFFSRTGWQDWDVAAEPAFPDRMPQLVDDDLLFEDAGVPRPGVAVNRWLRELPVSGAAAPGTWAKYAGAAGLDDLPAAAGHRGVRYPG
jgi:hypothetical protein